jgi:hypothetical protein
VPGNVTVFSTRTVLALSEIERAGVEAVPALVRTLITNAGQTAATLPGAAPVAPPPTSPAWPTSPPAP